MGSRVFHVGQLGRASDLKVITNMLAFIHLVACGEALMLASGGARPSPGLGGHRGQLGHELRARDRGTGDPQRELRHRLHARSRAQGSRSGAVARRGDRGAARARVATQRPSRPRRSATAARPRRRWWCGFSRRRSGRRSGPRASRPASSPQRASAGAASETTADGDGPGSGDAEQLVGVGDGDPAHHPVVVRLVVPHAPERR